MKNFLVKSLNGMTYGIFATIVVATILKQFGELINFNVLTTMVNDRLSLLLGVGIGVSIALSLKLEGLKFIVVSIAGGISTAFVVNFQMVGWYDPSKTTNNPITAYLVVALTYLFITKVFKKPTKLDLFIVPISGVIVSVLATYLVSWPIDRLMDGLYITIEASMNLEPITTCALISLMFGILITLPCISSAGIAIAVFSTPMLNGEPIAYIAAAAAVCGTTAQMVGFCYQSRKNDLGTIVSVGIATSMFQFKNIMKKPLIWIPTLVASLISGPVCYLIFNDLGVFQNTQFGAGMGSSGLVGQLQTLSINNYNLNGWLFVLAQILIPLTVVIIFDLIFIKKKLYNLEDLQISTDL